MSQTPLSEENAQVIAESCNGIQPPHLVFYILSIEYSARRCIQSFDSYFQNQFIENPDTLISYFQEAITHAAALSRFFWPNPQKKKGKNNFHNLQIKRGENLSQHFQINQTSPLYNRDLRNALEHFDERLDMYLLDNCSGLFFPSTLVSSDLDTTKNNFEHIFKLLCLEEGYVVLMGQKYYYLPIYQEAQRILIKCQKYLLESA